MQPKLMSTMCNTLNSASVKVYLKDLINKNNHRSLQFSGSVKLYIPRTKCKYGEQVFSISTQACIVEFCA